MHYNAADAEYYSPQQIIQTIDQNEVRQAAVTSIPTYLAKQLYQQAPDRILPLLGVYRDHDDDDWYELFISYPERIMIGIDRAAQNRHWFIYYHGHFRHSHLVASQYRQWWHTAHCLTVARLPCIDFG